MPHRKWDEILCLVQINVNLKLLFLFIRIILSSLTIIQHRQISFFVELHVVEDQSFNSLLTSLKCLIRCMLTL